MTEQTASFALTEDQELIRSTARQYLDDRLGLETVRELMMSEEGFDRIRWKELADLGWTGLAVAEAHGGAGYGMAEMGILLEEMGRRLTPGPFLPSAVMATSLIQMLADEAKQADLLPGLAGGEIIATPALFETPRGWSPAPIETSAVERAGGWSLHGHKRYVLEAAMADLLVVSARLGADLGLFMVETDRPGVSLVDTPSLDATRRQADVTLDEVSLPADALLAGPIAAEQVGRVMRLWSAALSCEQVGGAQECLDRTVDYAKTRYQFGRPIGSYQAVKHRLAEMLMKVEHARSTAMHAVRSGDDSDEMAIAGPLAASICSEAFVFASGEMIQLHGGIGFTWEHDAHLFLKRAKASSLLLGDPRYQRELLASALGL
jgi:alkylation response protein AidB-like acyl-CoA dehydrogenase